MWITNKLKTHSKWSNGRLTAIVKHVTEYDQEKDSATGQILNIPIGSSWVGELYIGSYKLSTVKFDHAMTLSDMQTATLESLHAEIEFLALDLSESL